MASISDFSALHPQVKIKGDQLVIEKGIVNSAGKAYDITINFKSGGKEVAPPMGLLQRETLVNDIQDHAQRILKSLHEKGIDTEHLERLGLRVQTDADGNPKTEILTSAAKPIFESLRSGNDGELQIRNASDFPMKSEENAPDGSKTLHEELLSFRGLFRAEYVMVLPALHNEDKEEIVPSKETPRLPDISLSFEESVNPPKTHPGRSRPPECRLFAFEPSVEKKREMMRLLEVEWKDFLEEHSAFNGITLEQLLGFRTLSERDEKRLRDLFANKEIKNSLYDRFQKQASKLCTSSLGSSEESSRRLLKRRLLDVLDKKWS